MGLAVFYGGFLMALWELKLKYLTFAAGRE
jgi:hypothetical protein